MKKISVLICLIGFTLITSGVSVNAIEIGNKIVFNKLDDHDIYQTLNNGITNITVQEAWNLLKDTSNGIQIPIDVRRNDEWNPEIIDTPIPEHPRHFCLDLLMNETFYSKFMSLYDELPIILYCKGGYRSLIAAKILLNTNFTGTINNMLGGITAWKSEGLPTTAGGIFNITAEDTLELCTDTLNGIQIPIDVRYENEWKAGYIDTPWPECPVWYCKTFLEDPEGLKEFLELYNGNEVILYCLGGYRSLLCSYILINSGFNGTIYNMLGGISSWQAEGYPIRNNTPPSAPEINGPPKGGVGEELKYTFTTEDAEADGVYYLVDWNDGSTSEWTGPFAIDEEIALNHTWLEKGTYLIKAKAKDFYGNESNWTELEISIPRNRAINFNIIIFLFKRFLNISPLLPLMFQRFKQ